MRNEYDFSKSIKNPYSKYLKKQVTLRLGVDVIEYFKNISEETGVPYQNLINLYLQDCARSQKKPKLSWAAIKSAEQDFLRRTGRPQPSLPPAPFRQNNSNGFFQGVVEFFRAGHHQKMIGSFQNNGVE